MEIILECGSNFPKADIVQWCDPYLIVKYTEGGVAKSFKATIQKNTATPVWNNHFECLTPSGQITFECWDWDKMNSDDFLGKVVIDVPELTKLEETIIYRVDLEKEYEKKRKNNDLDTTITIKYRNLHYVETTPQVIQTMMTSESSMSSSLRGSSRSIASKKSDQQIQLEIEEGKKREYLKGYLPILQGFTKKANFRLLFSSDLFPVKADVIAQKIMMKRNVMTLIITQSGCSFGFYNDEPITKDENGNGQVINDKNGFVFSVVGPKQQPLKLNTINPKDATFCLFNGIEHTSGIVLGVNNAFYLKEDMPVYELNTIQKSFDATVKGNVLLSEYFPSTFPIAKVFMLQWM
uniref:C2 domain-containing protein n=1 Tax=Entamoeba invadens TaxID=33085 RepID=S0AY00_ENTIV|nr:hypothetical protein [Entamoeba invadens]